MQVWIDQDLCTGDGLCEQICPEVFRLQPDGLSYVHDDVGLRDRGAADPGRSVAVAEWFAEGVIDAAAECPGECIFIEESAMAAA